MLAQRLVGGPHGDPHGRAGQRTRRWPVDLGPPVAGPEGDAGPMAFDRHDRWRMTLRR
jgi:hypothetical protein